MVRTRSRAGAATLALAATAGAALTVAAGPAEAETTYAATTANTLLRFDSATPGTIDASTAITGLGAGEQIEGLDFRPATGQLYALGKSPSGSRALVVDPATGTATPVGTAPFTPALGGTAFGFDFNPVPGAIRIVGNNRQSLRANAATGAIAGTDASVTFAVGDANAAATPNIVGSAYTNNVAGANSTTLYGIDSNLDVLVRQGGPGGVPSPNGGQLSTIGGLGVDTSDDVGLDISAGSGVAFAALKVGATSGLYRVELSGGTATLIGAIGGGGTVRALAVAPPPGSMQFGAATVGVSERAGSATVTVTRTGGTMGASTVNYATSDGTATSASGDYTPASGTLSFAAGETSKTFAVPVGNDALVEDPETVSLALTAATGSGSLGAPNVATLNVFDDDQAPPPPLAPAPPPPAPDAPPTVAFASPPEGARLPATRATTIALAAGDDRGVAAVELRAGGRVICRDTRAPYACAFTPTTLDVGRPTLAATATDTAGQTVTAVRSYVVRRLAPRRLTARTTGTRRLVTTGRLSVPAGPADPRRCSGLVSVRYTAASGLDVVRLAGLSTGCTFRASANTTGGRKVTVRATFLGNEVLVQRSAPPQVLRRR